MRPPLEPVVSISLAPDSSNLVVGASRTLVATVLIANGQAVNLRDIAWTSSSVATATVSRTGVVTAVATGIATITAISEGKAATARITVDPLPECTEGNAPALDVGQVVMLTETQKSLLCISGGIWAAEYGLVLFNPLQNAAQTVPVTLSGLNTLAPAPAPSPAAPAITAPAHTAPPLGGVLLSPTHSANGGESHWAFMEEQRTLFAAMHSGKLTTAPAVHARMLPLPVEGSIVQLNASADFFLCNAVEPHPARVLKVLRNTILYVDELAPAGGFSDSEMIALATAFDTLGYPLDTLNFGAPGDMDGNGRLGLFFTPAVNRYAGSGLRLTGFTAYRDLLDRNACPASNAGEIFYIAVPDPSSVINTRYQSKAGLLRDAPAVLVHELQHVINASRNAQHEEAWLSEGLSHIAEELLYYKLSGDSVEQNIGVFFQTEAQGIAFDGVMFPQLTRLRDYWMAPEANSPFANNDAAATRGAAWQLLRYAADRKGGDQRATWRALVSTTKTGRSNFNATFGDLTSFTRDWAVAQLMDDFVPGTATVYTNPSWNWRSFFQPTAPPNGPFPLSVRTLLDAPISLQLSGGGASYLQFRVAGGTDARVRATSSGNPPSGVDFMLVRTR